MMGEIKLNLHPKFTYLNKSGNIFNILIQYFENEVKYDFG